MWFLSESKIGKVYKNGFGHRCLLIAQSGARYTLLNLSNFREEETYHLALDYKKEDQSSVSLEIFANKIQELAKYRDALKLKLEAAELKLEEYKGLEDELVSLRSDNEKLCKFLSGVQAITDEVKLSFDYGD